MPFSKAVGGVDGTDPNDDGDSDTEGEDEDEVEDEREEFDEGAVEYAMKKVNETYNVSTAESKAAKSSLTKVSAHLDSDITDENDIS